MPVRIMLFIAAFVLAGSLHVVVAQSPSTPVTGNEFGLPELHITATDGDWRAPDEIPAGRYLLTLDYQGNEEFGTAALVRLPDSWSYQDLSAAIAAEQQLEFADMEATPTAPDSSQVASPESIVEPTGLLYSLTYAGGLSVLAGETSTGIVDLQPGNWAIWADNFDVAPRPLKVTGIMPTDLVQPQATASITQINVGDRFGLRIEGEIVAGRNVIEISNASDEPHLVEFVRVSMPMTPMEFFSLVLQTETGEPMAGVPVPTGAELEYTSYYAATMSSGLSQWLIVDLQPGDYYLTCWVHDRDQPAYSHAVLGELELVTVE